MTGNFVIFCITSDLHGLALSKLPGEQRLPQKTERQAPRYVDVIWKRLSYDKFVDRFFIVGGNCGVFYYFPIILYKFSNAYGLDHTPQFNS